VDKLQTKLEQRIALEIDEHLKVVELQAKLDVAVEALGKIPHTCYHHPALACAGCMAQEALKRLEA
jgi:hypothetical protein